MRTGTLFGAILILSTCLVAIDNAQAAKVGQTCGGLAGIKCDNGLWCDPQPGKCGGADVSGKCIKVPELCTQAKIKQFKPVCGCDGTTYSNNCERQVKNVALKSLGACK